MGYTCVQEWLPDGGGRAAKFAGGRDGSVPIQYMGSSERRFKATRTTLKHTTSLG